MQTIGVVALAACFAFAAVSARSQSLDVNFYNSGYGGSTASGAAVVGSADDIWNGIDVLGSADSDLGLVDTSGDPISATLSYDTIDGGAVTSAATSEQPNPSLMSDYLFNNDGGQISVTLDGLADDTEYNLYIYLASQDASDGSRAADVTVNGTEETATGNPETSFSEGDNYLLFQTVSSDSGEIDITEADDSNNTDHEVDMNGLQLEPVPEPSLASLACLGLLVFQQRKWLFRRKSS